ncbi:MAG: UDP-N-acetylmuramate:L-alanyl-gamma-D-glutamyl-meso-diaminopimelate ligase [Gammaproteobacteria bacterium HGW-Gammaproteobacteria-2]|jgi:UDP-N-acetylmuramate: L-alanyl-gamma-D-glutamyl-meso-diaminopimelate ligase|nr:MAG: UDP-N-acetylmuramate:L-alanyl-gamma-D-glutamyl-meso-diaminopimelate ligase [Gammaproteobacteria bacterium HGW-Gammaproteobacteria-2]
MKLHILGICGTFMGGVAALARELGHQVSGSDANVYPPMSNQLQALGIALTQGYAPEHIPADADAIVVGNALSRGNPSVEAVLDAGRAYTSGAQWLAENVLPGRRTLAVAGTHGKTTTSSLLAYILDRAGRDPGFLIGGVPENFGVSARIGGAGAPPSSGPAGHLPTEGEGIKLRPLAATHSVRHEFVVEADEYDTAFFDKRSKFVHYRPWLAILNNLEYDHADIFPDVAAIQRQFHHLLRIVPGNGRLIVNADDDNLAQVLAMGCWTTVETFGERADADWRARLDAADGSEFTVLHRGQAVATARWSLLGRHNVMNALAAIAAAHAVGVPVADAVAALTGFRSVKRRLEVIGRARDITVYDDFAHHPTAIATTLAGLRANVGSARIVVAMEPRSNSMRLGAHAAQLAPSLAAADAVVFLHRPGLPWDAGAVIDALHGRARTAPDTDALLAELRTLAQPGDHVVFMSNGGFDGAPQRFFDSL